MARYLLMLKADASAEIGAPPQSLFEAIGELAVKWGAEGVLLDTGGLAPTAMGNRVRLSGGEIGVEDGPFTEAETVDAYAIVNADSQKAAVELAAQFIALHREHWPVWQGCSEVRQIFGGES